MRINFARGVPAPESFPVADILGCASQVVSRNMLESLQYGPARGPASFVRWIAERYSVNDMMVLTGDGSLGLFELFCSVMLKPGDTVFVESPTYDRVIEILTAKGARVVAIALQEDGPDLEQFKSALADTVPKFFYLIPDFQNPSGLTCCAEKRAAIAALARQHNILLVEDAPYRLIRYTGSTLPSFFELAPELTLHMSSLSKIIAPGLRAGYVVGNEALIGKLVKAAENRYVTPGNFALSIAGEWCRQGHLPAQLAALIALYGPRLHAMTEALTAALPELHFSRPQGGFFLGLHLPPGISNSAVREQAQQLGLALSDGKGFFLTGGEHFLRIPFCGLTVAEIQEGVAILRRAVELARPASSR